MIRSLAEFLGSRQAALLALFLKCGGFALSDGLLDVDHLFTRKSQRNTGRFTAADDEGLAASVEMVVIAEDGGTGKRYRYVHPIAVTRITNLRLRLEITRRPLMPGKPRKTSFPGETFTVKDGLHLSSEGDGLNSALSSYRQLHRRPVLLAGDSHR